MGRWTALAVAGLLTWGAAGASAQLHVLRFEAEDAELAGVMKADARAASGSGYVTSFAQAADKVTFQVTVPSAGMYELRIRYCCPGGGKGYDLAVNGDRISGFFAPTAQAFVTHEACIIELSAGDNTVTIGKGWGYFDVDYIEIAPAHAPRPPLKPTTRLSDPNASASTRALTQDLIDRYGEGTLTGVYNPKDAAKVYEITGKHPAVFGGDFMEYSPSRVEHGAKPGRHSEEMIEQHQAGHIITMSWHWNAPAGLIDKKEKDQRGREVDKSWYKGFNSNATTFDIAAALADKESAEYRLVLRDIDVIAGELGKFAAADVPILWRPLHEAEGKWFWWGAKGAAPCIELWRLLHDRLTNHHNLHDLIWVWTSGGDMSWYPGDEYVDIIGVDSYPDSINDPLSEIWEKLNRNFAGQKLVALSEIGEVPDIQRMRRFGVHWSYFAMWHGYLSRGGDEYVKRVYTGEGAINRGEVRRRPQDATSQPAP
jgi:mannan endo-1,4-beta-mannosidase